jgi:hypothetical protein
LSGGSGAGFSFKGWKLADTGVDIMGIFVLENPQGDFYLPGNEKGYG